MTIGSGSMIDNIPSGGAITIACWIRPESLGESSIGFIYGKTATIPTAMIQLSMAGVGTNSFKFEIGHATTNALAIAANSSLTLNVWQFIVAEWQAGQGGPRLYVKPSGGSLTEVTYATRTAESGAVGIDAAASAMVGCDTGNVFNYDGGICHFFIYSSILDMGEKSRLSDDFMIQTGTPQRAFLPMYGGFAAEPDYSTFGNNGTVSGPVYQDHPTDITHVIEVVGHGAKGEAASGNITLGNPSVGHGTPVTGDLWIAVVHSTAQVAHTFSGWTQVAQGNGGGSISRLSVWRAPPYAGSVPNLVVGQVSGGPIVGAITAFRNIRATTPVEVIGSLTAGAASLTISHANITELTDRSILMLCDGAADDNARSGLPARTFSPWEDATAGSQLCYVTTLGVDGSVAMHLRQDYAKAATGSVNTTQATSDVFASILLALAPIEFPVVVTDPALLQSSTYNHLALGRYRVVAF